MGDSNKMLVQTVESHRFSDRCSAGESGEYGSVRLGSVQRCADVYKIVQHSLYKICMYVCMYVMNGASKGHCFD